MLRNWFSRLMKSPSRRKLYLVAMMLAFGAAYALSPGEGAEGSFQFFTPLDFETFEKVCIFVVLGLAVAGLVYALLLAKQVRQADQGTPKMQEIAEAVREGANAYLGAQFKQIVPAHRRHHRPARDHLHGQPERRSATAAPSPS